MKTLAYQNVKKDSKVRKGEAYAQQWDPDLNQIGEPEI